ncbi:phosphonate ABC transporter, permease protein PhnE [Fictibacillus phosphorivorans]|uniref:phosphonate ABC transporter, permease protein PhnE n=1 Tax=Fictibacillus phosphorivorans TaxID=1221500 RepID=UPI00203EF310|nr:phosphonate ABC transporter, permease protein PhnE [Fictibacillus phosphorivorans]MCM3717041.1 phosphonate ABC transporter, permease protein PhnE [Fictibacillus phosphorivorans]MCM3774728.1 phosphonate ABC transporter, permease protein PhnE [Fictibacillus phosphorivorans]
MVWFKKRQFIVYLIIGILAGFCMRLTEFDLSKFQDFKNMGDFLSKWFPMNLESLPYLFQESLLTIAIAFLGSLFGLIIGLPLSFLAARNTSGHRLVFTTTRFYLSFLRSVPEFVFGLILLTTLGLGPFPAVIAIVLHNIGVLGKLISELIEASDKGPMEAMSAVGANRWIGNLFAILPQIWPNVLSQYFYRFEVAIRTSLILGMIGGGGIGQQLFIHFKTFQYQLVSVDVLLIMIMVILVDYIGGKIREKVI